MTKAQRGFEVLDDYKEQGIPLPRRATDLSSGHDLASADDVILPAGKRMLINTGLTAYMLPFEELQIRPRSGIALSHGVTVLNSPGTIDADYYPRHVKVLLVNTGDEDFVINKGDRIAQAVFAEYKITDHDDPKERKREGGFGHSGTR